MATASGKKEFTFKEVTLTLTSEEAEALVSVLMRVGGTPTKSPRGNIESILEALRNLGVKDPNYIYDSKSAHLFLLDQPS